MAHKLGEVQRRLGLVARTARHHHVARRVAPPRAHAVQRRHPPVPALPGGRQLRPAVEALALVHQGTEPPETEAPPLVAGPALAPGIAERAPRALLLACCSQGAHALSPDVLFVAMPNGLRLRHCIISLVVSLSGIGLRVRETQVGRALHLRNRAHEAGVVDASVAPRQGGDDALR